MQEARALAARLAAAKRALKRAAARVVRAVKKAASFVKKAAVTVGKAVYKYSGAQSVVSCVTHPDMASCVQAAVAVAGAVLTVATGGAGAAADVGLEAAMEAGTDVAVDAAEEGAETAAEDAGTETASSGLKDMTSDVWNKVKPAGTTRPLLQMGLGAAGGGINSFADNVQQLHQEGWGRVIANTALGAATGAVGNMGGGFGIKVGFAAGAADSLGTDLFNTGR